MQATMWRWRRLRRTWFCCLTRGRGSISMPLHVSASGNALEQSFPVAIPIVFTCKHYVQSCWWTFTSKWKEVSKGWNARDHVEAGSEWCFAFQAISTTRQSERCEVKEIAWPWGYSILTKLLTEAKCLPSVCLESWAHYWVEITDGSGISWTKFFWSMRVQIRSRISKSTATVCLRNSWVDLEELQAFSTLSTSISLFSNLLIIYIFTFFYLEGWRQLSLLLDEIFQLLAIWFLSFFLLPLILS